MLHPLYDLQILFDHTVDDLASVFGKGFIDTIGNNGVDGQTMMTEYTPQSEDSRSLHFEIGDTMLFE